jgi:light-harvesting complex I chlorophyll a/b binding protein 1
MRVLAFLSLLATVAAFIPNSLNNNVPVSAGRTSGVMKMSFQNSPGVIAPLGYFDPAGFAKDGDQAKFNRYRAIEIKHGRIAMLAMTHVFVTHFVKLPGLLSSSSNIAFADVPSGLAALKVVPVAGWLQVILFQAALEINAPQDPTKAPGDVQPDTTSFPKLEKYDEAGALAIQNKELSNGRLAMMAIAGTWASDAITGSKDVIDVVLGN